MLSGFYANSNLDDGKDTRSKIIAEVDENFDDLIAKIYGGGPIQQEEEFEIDWSDPFFAPVKRANDRYAKLAGEMTTPVDKPTPSDDTGTDQP